jgi:hypothetical protein
VAVTVEGTFRIIDRASRTLENIERHAKQADRAVEKLGRSLDLVASKQHIDGLAKLDQNMGKVEKSSVKASRELEKQTNVLDRHRRKTEQNTSALERFGKKMILVFGGLGKVFGLLKLPLIIGGVAQLIPLIAALGAGVVSLLPKIGQLAGVLGALPATFAGLGLAMATVKLAFSDIKKAMSGNADALARLTPAARRFTETLKSWKPLVDEFRKSAQGGLFSGLDAALERLKVTAPTINRLLAMMGNTLGRLAQQAAGRFTNQGFLADLLGIGQQGGRIVSRMGRGLMNLVDALRHVAVAARPFTDWLTLTLYRWTRWIDAAAKAGRETGRLREFFAHTRTTLEQFGRIVQNVYFALRDVMRIAAPMGESLWSGIERATRAWRDWQASVQGQVATRRFWNSTLATLEQIWGLIQDLGKALGRLGGNQAGAAGLVATLRKAVPPLERILANFQKAFGPEMGQLIANIARTLELLTGNMIGPFTVALALFNRLLSVVNSLLSRFPQLGQAILVALAVSRVMGMAGAVSRLAASWGAVATNAGRAAAAEAAASGGGFFGGLFRRGGKGGKPPVGFGLPQAAARGGRFAGLGRGAALAAGGAGKFLWPIAAGMAALDAYGAERSGGVRNQIAQTVTAALSGATFGLTPQYRGDEMERQSRLTELATSAESVRVGTTPSATAGRASIGGRGTTAAEASGHRTAVGAAIYQPSFQQRLAPILAAPSATAAQQQVSINALSSLSGSIRGERDSAKNKETQAFLAGLQSELATRNEILRTTRAQEKADKRRRAAEYGAGLNAAIDRGMDPMTGQPRNRRRTRAELRAATTLDLRRMTGADVDVARDVGLARLKADREMLKAHPELKGQVERDEKEILKRFDKLGIDIKKKGRTIVDNTAEGVKGLAAQLAKPGEQVAQLVDTAMTKAEKRYIAHMRSLGYSEAAAKKFVAQGEQTGDWFMGSQAPPTTPSSTGMGGGGSTGGGAPVGAHGPGRARGGRIPGRGLMDTVPIAPGQMAAPGELVVNRHTENKVDRLLGRPGALGGMVNGETRPHHAKMATGGRVSDALIGQVASQYGLDPAAWAAIMWHESRLNPSAIGDSGTSFGLTQLHIGGALGNMSVAQARQYLDPMMNLQFAGAAMQRMGLSGLTGPAAISAYSRQFERPANPAAEIADALAFYRTHAGNYAGTSSGLGEAKMGVMPGLARGGRVGGLDLSGGYAGGSALARAIRAANAIDSQHYPYAWGGGHGRIGVPSSGTRHSSGGPMGVGFDCSGATSAVLGAAGLLGSPTVAKSFMSMFARGYDPNGINVVASPSHVYMMLAGHAFGTSTANPNGGAGWFSGGIRSGFVVNHVGNPGALGDVGVGGAPALGLRPTAGGLAGFPGAQAMGATGAQAAVLNRAAGRADATAGLGFATGGRVGWGGWFAGGGRVRASRPTLIGIGDGPGTETATITKGGSGGGHTFVVRIGQIVNHGGDVEAEIDRAFRSLANRLKSQGVVDDSEVMA